MQTGKCAGLAAMADMPASLFQHSQRGTPGRIHSGQLVRRSMLDHILSRHVAETGTFTLQQAHGRTRRFGTAIKTVKNRRLTRIGVLGELFAELIGPCRAKLGSRSSQQMVDFLLFQRSQNPRRHFPVQHLRTCQADSGLVAQTGQRILRTIADGRPCSVRISCHLQNPIGRPTGHLGDQRDCIQVVLVDGPGSAQLLDHLPRLCIGIEQAHGVSQFRGRGQLIQMHLAQGAIADTADIGQRQQGVIGVTIGKVPDASQRGQAIPRHGLFQAQAPGTVAVMAEQRLVSQRVGGMFQPPVPAGAVKRLLIEPAALAHPGCAGDAVLPRRVGPRQLAGDERLFIAAQGRPPQAPLAIRQRHRVQIFDHRLRFNGCHPIECCSCGGHRADLRKVFSHVDKMRPGGVFIPLAPLDHAFDSFVEQLGRHDNQHDFAQYRNEHGRHVQRQQTKLQQPGQLGIARLGVDVGGRYRVTTSVVDDLVTMFFVQVRPEVAIPRPRIYLKVRHQRNCHVRIGIRDHFLIFR